MTVDFATGEIVEFDAVAARDLTDKIKFAIDGTWQLIVEAYQSRAWLALGYSSWDDYCTREFGSARLQLPREDRAEYVASLRESGLSLRAISSATGNAINTIRNDLYQIDTPNSPVSSLGGEADDGAGQTSSETPPSTAGVEAGAPTPEVQSVRVEHPPAPRPTVTGIDGKTYTRLAPKVTPIKPTTSDWDEQDRAEELADNLAAHISLLYAVTNPDRRAEYIANWRRGTATRPVLGQNFVTPQHMRDLAQALQAFATEWEQAK